jgi:hypothetical protein
VSDIEQTPEDCIAPGRQLISRDNKHGVGIDVGWRVGGLDIWWGNTRDGASLLLLIADARKQGYDFYLAADVINRTGVG